MLQYIAPKTLHNDLVALGYQHHRKFFHLDWPEKGRPQVAIIPGSGGGH